MNLTAQKNIAIDVTKILTGVKGEPEITQTTDDTPTIIGTLAAEDNTGGMVEVRIIAAAGGNDAYFYVTNYFKTGGDITVETPVGVYEKNDTLGTSVSITGSAGNLIATGTGVAATNINWICRMNVLQNNATVLP